jgi:FtsH-binding integral membrane protein
VDIIEIVIESLGKGDITMSFYPNSNAEARPAFLDLNAVMRQVYLWMALGLGVSAITAYGFAASGLTLYVSGNLGLSLMLMVVYFILAFALQPIIMRAQPMVGAACYLALTAVFGISLSGIFYYAKIQTIGLAFVSTSAMFAAMTVFGYTTRRDLSGMRNILYMALIGLIVASIINIFLAGNNMLYWLINYAGVLIFAGFTAYDTQWIKNYASAVATSGNPDAVTRIALVGAFHLYLDFVNLFIFLLSIMNGGGSRRRF